MEPFRIAIVEDEGIVALDIQDRLAVMGYQTVGCAATREGAVTLVDEERPDLVLLDIRLQGNGDGIDAAIEIRNRFKLPVIFLTAYSEDATLERAKLAEPSGYILKPFNDRELKSTIEIALYKHRAEEEIRRMTRLFDVLSQINQAVARLRNRDELLEAICRQMVERGAIDLAWIGWLDAESSRIVPVAAFGDQSEMPAVFDYSLSEGQDNPGEVIREGKPFVCNKCNSRECPLPGVNASGRSRFESRASFPLKCGGEVCAVLTLCVAQPEFFRERELELLKEVALDVSFALDKIEGDLQRENVSRQYQHQSVFLATLMDAMPFPVLYKDAARRYLGCNRAFEKFAGLGRDQIIGKTVYEILPQELARLHDGHDSDLLGKMSPQPEVYEATLRSGDGSCRHILVHKALFRNHNGAFEGIIDVMEDVTDKKLAEQKREMMEEALRRSHDELESRVRERTDELNQANMQLRSFPAKLLSVQEEERKRLGAELHDSVGQTLAAVKYSVELALKFRNSGDINAAFNHLEQLVPILQRSIEETRNIYMGLRPTILDSSGLLATITWLRQENLRLFPSLHIEFETTLKEEDIPEILKVPIFRIIQESLNNITKHSRSEWVDISLAKNGDGIELVVSDDGVGMNVSQVLRSCHARSLGLTSMMERARLSGGRLSVESTPGEGTSVHAFWPKNGGMGE